MTCIKGLKYGKKLTCELRFVSADLVALAREDARGDSQDSHSNIPGERTEVYQGGGVGT